MYCYCENPAVVQWESRPKARKAHHCNECGRTIKRGERYEHVYGVWQDGPGVFNTCVYCLAVRDTIQNYAGCFCWEYGNMLENMRDWLNDDDTPGLKMAIGRILCEARNDSRAS